MNIDFTVVTAAYNSEKYLDDYFESILVHQTYQGGAIKIVLVDDGSADATRLVVEDWSSRYPGRIQYVYKKNGGQGSARNLGIRLAETEWITFIDSDDFVDSNYFENVASNLRANPSAVMACCNNIRYNEAADSFTNSHFLQYRFSKGDVFVDLRDENLYPQHSAALAFFRKSVIDVSGVCFPENLRVSFEDALFVGRYLLSCAEGSVGFLASAKYYARRRADGSSTTDSSATREYYIDCIEKGHLALLREYAAVGAVPRNIQRTVFYDLTWRLKKHIDGPATIDCLTEDENLRYRHLLEQVFAHIDIDVIRNAPASVFWFYYKAGLASYYKKQQLDKVFVYIDHLDVKKKEVTLRFFGSGYSVKSRGNEVKPIEVKDIDHSLFGSHFITESYKRFAFGSLLDSFDIELASGGKAEIKYKKKTYTGKSFLDLILGSQKGRLRYVHLDDTWLVSDLINKADDNGEHFYRYLKQNHPRQRAFYVLDRKSSDWDRLQSEGFRLLAFGTKKYEKELRRASVLISSQILDGTINYFGDHYRDSKRFVFLQHGTIKDDLSRWINRYWIDLLITSSADEYESVTRDGSDYRIFKSQVVLSGQARHDRLLEMAKKLPSEKIILIAPTWRKSLSGALSGSIGERDIVETFGESEFCRMWSELMNSSQLRDLCERFGYRLVFAPHPNLAVYAELGFFEVPDYIEVKPANASWQNEFVRAEVMITDYSSNAFEMALLRKPTLYYQFDRDSFFQGHTYSKGYFEYERDGFGPVSEDMESLLVSLEALLSGELLDESYLSNMESCFAYRDGRSCERIYERIKALDFPSERF